MSIYYFDADAQVKYFINEPGSLWVRQLADEVDVDGDPLRALFTIEISQVEVSAALSILRRSGRFGNRLHNRAFGNYLTFAQDRLELIAVDANIIAEASAFAKTHPLKALDAIHLAAAIQLNRELTAKQMALTLVSGDYQLLTAAEAEGLLTENPVDHDEETG